MNSILKSIMLHEGITHIEDLSPSEFIQTVKSLKHKIVTEKLDGSNLWFGLDDIGVFTTREGKSPKSQRCYNVDDYAMVANYNGFRAAHLAIEKIEPDIRANLEGGDMVEMEVLFGRQPNTVTYGVSDKNFIVILRGVNGTPDERVNKLADAINGKKVKVESTIVTSPDGDQIELDDQVMTWEFTEVKPIQNSHIDLSEVNSLLTSMEKYLKEKNKVFSDKSNEEVAAMSLTSVGKENRAAASDERDHVKSVILNDFKLPIKEILLNRLVRKIKPLLQADDLHPDEDIGVEGVVVRDPVTGSQTKIVDKDVFTAINTFNSSIRANAAGLVRTTDQDAPLELRGGAFGQAKIEIANLLGVRELALSSGTKRYISKFKGDNIQSTIDSFAKSLNISDIDSVKSKIVDILEKSLSEVTSILDNFQKEKDDYKLKLKTGKELGISPEVLKRTFTAFAETKKDIKSLIKAIRDSDNAKDIVNALYGRTINSLFIGNDKEVVESMNLLKMINEDADACTTSSADVAAPEKTVFKDGRMITRRKRTFVKPKKFPMPSVNEKFSLLKGISEDWAHVKDMKYATDVDDKADSSDVEFKKLRNTVMGDDISADTVNKYLDKAHEINDEVDTVAFGLETDDDKVIKVYVNAEQADKFEETLAKMLSTIDDTEEVINTLANDFDIVDVEWPKDMVNDTESSESSNTSDNEEGDEDEISLIDDEESTENSDTNSDTNSDMNDGEMDFTTASDEESSSEGESDEDGSSNEIDDYTLPSDETSTDDSQSTSSEDETTGDETSAEASDTEGESDELEGSDESSDDEEESSSEENAEDEDSEEEETNDFGQPKRKLKSKKQTNMEESMSTVKNIFRMNMLGEQKRIVNQDSDHPDAQMIVDKHAGEDEIIQKLLKSLPSVKMKAVVTLMVNLGAPKKILAIHKSELRKTAANSADMFATNAAFRMWSKKLLNALAKADASKVLESDLSDRLNNKYQKMILDVLRALGLPATVEQVGARVLVANIKELAKIIVSDSDVKIYFKSLAEVLGVADKTAHMTDEIKESTLMEADSDAAVALSGLLTSMGFDLDKPISFNRQKNMMAVKSSLNKLSANTTVLAKMDMLTNLINNRLKVKAIEPQFSSVQVSGKTIVEKAEDRGEWNIGKMGSSGLLLTLDDVKIKMSKDEAAKLAIGLDDGKKVSVHTKDDERYVFKPLKNGKEFSVSRHSDDGDSEEILISADQVQELLDTINSED